PKGMTIKDAFKRWEEINEGEEITEAAEVKLNGMYPPVEKMDSSLGSLVNVEYVLYVLKLSLSTNMVDKITGLQGLKNLRILSLGRNYIKSFSGLEAVAETLEQLWISYNQIEKLKGVQNLKNLRVLYMSNNLVKDWAEFDRLKELPKLEDLVFENNPLQLRYMNWHDWCLLGVLPRLPALVMLEGKPTVEAKKASEGGDLDRAQEEWLHEQAGAMKEEEEGDEERSEEEEEEHRSTCRRSLSIKKAGIIMTGNTVNRVFWSNRGTKLETTAGDYTCGWLIVTIPLGALKVNQCYMLLPDLPTWKSEAIDKIDMAKVNKLFME
ncbi:unnamed protein product, partial [Cyprideis torosa]